MRARQLALDLPVETAYGREDFLVGAANADAFAMIESWPRWPDRLLGLTGPAGSGKSHLAAIWAELAGATVLRGPDLSSARVPDLAGGALAIEDLDRGIGDEAALFHLVNMARERGGFVLFTSSLPLGALKLRIPDLVSRLRLAPNVALGAPDDGLLKAVLVKLFHDRQVAVEAGVVDYVAGRIERSLAAAGGAVAALDREALSRGRRVTRPMAGAVLEALRVEPSPDDHHASVTSGA